jgi:hypothetical protein
MKEDEVDMACSTHGRKMKYKDLVRKSERKGTSGRLRCRWADNINIHPKGRGRLWIGFI